MPSKIQRLLALSAAEFDRGRTQPSRQRFKGLKVDLQRLDGDWERQRGAAVRLMGVILREDSEALAAKVGADPKAYQDAAEWFAKEGTTLRKTAARMDTAATRLTAALARQPVAPNAPPAGSPSGSPGA